MAEIIPIQIDYMALGVMGYIGKRPFRFVPWGDRPLHNLRWIDILVMTPIWQAGHKPNADPKVDKNWHDD